MIIEEMIEISDEEYSLIEDEANRMNLSIEDYIRNKLGLPPLEELAHDGQKINQV